MSLPAKKPSRRSSEPSCNVSAGKEKVSNVMLDTRPGETSGQTTRSILSSNKTDDVSAERSDIAPSNLSLVSGYSSSDSG